MALLRVTPDDQTLLLYYYYFSLTLSMPPYQSAGPPNPCSDGKRYHPMYRLEHLSSKEWECEVTLPATSPLPSARGTPSLVKRAAKGSAALQACILLHSIGALNDYMLPVRLSEADVEEAAVQQEMLRGFEEEEEEKEMGMGAGKGNVTAQEASAGGGGGVPSPPSPSSALAAFMRMIDRLQMG
jgi:hypothetical protein